MTRASPVRWPWDWECVPDPRSMRGRRDGTLTTMRATHAPRGRREGDPAPPCVSRRSAWRVALFRRYARRYVARSFHAVRLARGTRPSLPEGPVVVVLNHPSWWDPLIALVLTDLWPDRVPFAPIESRALARYGFFDRLGFFGVEPGTARGARTFLRTSLAIAEIPNAMLWVTAQGQFTDVRRRPVVLRGGVGHLVGRLDRGCVVPLALEYPFWNERGPEALARFGRPIAIADAGGGRGGPSADAWTALIARDLEATQDALAVEAQGRDPRAFEVLLAGGAGVGGVYDLWRRTRAGLLGRGFRPEHDRDR